METGGVEIRKGGPEEEGKEIWILEERQTGS